MFISFKVFLYEVLCTKYNHNTTLLPQYLVQLFERGGIVFIRTDRYSKICYQHLVMYFPN